MQVRFHIHTMLRTAGFLILLVLTYSASLGATQLNGNKNNLSTDKSSLAALKLHITSDPKNILKEGWPDSTFVCNWTGVTCGTDPPRVVALNLSYAGLVGTIPPHFGNLSSLVEFRLTNNTFHGTLPRELSRLKRLKLVDFSLNNFTGSVPSWFGSLPKLQGLVLENNNFSGSIPSAIFNSTSIQAIILNNNQLSGTIPRDIENLQLKMLDLSFNSFTGQVPLFSFNMSSLKIIDFSRNGFSDKLPDNICQHLPVIEEMNFRENELSGSLPSKLWQCKELRVLSLRINKFTGNIPKDIGNLTHLRELQLGENMLTGNVPEEIGSMHNLETLNTYDNALKGEFPQFVFNISSLKTLALSGNSFYGTLPHNLCQHIPNIQRLYLVENNMSGRIPSRLSECKQLRVLSLGINGFYGTIPKTISNLSGATEIYINFNLLTGTIPEEMGKLANLENFHIADNNISGVVPSSFFNISRLKIVYLSYNKLSGGLPRNNQLWLPNLQYMYIHNNSFTGQLPESFFNASELVKLDISNNHFSGFIPNSLTCFHKLWYISFGNNNLMLPETADNILSKISTFTDLFSIDLSNNPLNATLPSSMGSNVSNSLEKIYLTNCKLRGRIPFNLPNLSRLIDVRLGVNQLSGSIPPSIGMLQNLQGLDLGDNMLDGQIPLQLCRLRSMSELDLHKNKLSGSIPWCLGNTTTSLRKLYLASNKFASTIPPTIWGHRDILELDFSSNLLTGSLSTQIGNLKDMTYFNVSNNHLSGSISTSVGDLESLTYLDLASNYFRDSIPDSVGNLLSLEHLDLSNNSFSGVIPKSLDKLSHLRFLNLSFNKLNGEIPSGGPFSNFSAQSFIQNDNLCGASRLQVPPCKSKPRKASKVLLLKWIIPSALTAVIIVLALLIIAFRMKRMRTPDSEAALVTQRRVSRFELSTATNGFKEENLLGVGGFGSVYKGTLSDGLIVAVKVFNLQLNEAFQSFASECEVLCNVRHRNLVKIITCCSSPDFKALVLQYMPLGSLDKWLYSGGAFLNLMQRLNVMIDVASALEYLHYGYSTPIVHCDLKPSNVLLDENMVAHVADFGVAKLLNGEDSMTQTMTLATIGYMAPEYGIGGVVSRKGDVYSFGIVLMEVFTKKKPIDEMFSEEMNLKQWVEKSFPNAISEVIDDDLDREHLLNKDCVTSVLELALACSASSPQARIDMKIAVSTLNKIKIKYLKTGD